MCPCIGRIYLHIFLFYTEGRISMPILTKRTAVLKRMLQGQRMLEPHELLTNKTPSCVYESFAHADYTSRRIFFKSSTRMPLHPDLLDWDSESEIDLQWLKTSADRVLKINLPFLSSNCCVVIELAS
jgi:hypothetical protein